MVIPLIGGGNGGSRLQGDWYIRHKEAEYSHAVYCDATDYGPLGAVHLEARSVGVLTVVGIVRFIFLEGKEEGSGRIGWRGGDKQRGGNTPGNDNRSGMRAGVQNSKLTYLMDWV